MTESNPRTPEEGAGDPMPGTRGLPRLFWLALLPFGYLVARFNFVCDDAYISFRYSKNLIRGHGLTFNIADSADPVEGYSNFLWVLLMALGELLGIGAPTLSRILSIACGLGALVLIGRFLNAKSRGGGPRAAILGGLLFATFPPFALWSTSGLATMPVTLCYLGLFVALWSNPDRPRVSWAILASVCGVLLRADGFLTVGLILAGSAVLALGAERRALRSAILRIGIAVALTVGSHFLFRYLYYGDWLPNTARAKVHLDELGPELKADALRRGTNYLLSFALAFPAVLLVLLGIPLLLGRARARRAWVLPALLVLVGTWAYARHVTGDFMTMGRFLVPTLPLFVLVLASALGPWLEDLRKPKGLVTALVAAAAIVASILPACNLHAVPYDLRAAYHYRWNQPEAAVQAGTLHMQSEYERWEDMKRNADRWAVQGKAMALHTKADETLAAGGIGAIGYYCDIYIYDTYGLTNREVLEAPFSLKQLKSPGHDRAVGVDFFADKNLTYLGAGVVPSDDPAAGLPAQWRGVPPERLPVDLELHPLRSEDGLPEGQSLLLLRMKRGS